MATGDPDRADELYALPLGEFTAARNALARQLAREGDKTAAEAVKRLAKPARAAWVLNQLARGRPGEVEALLEVGDRLREAQRAALEGDAGGLRAATRAQQEVVDRLVAAALDVDAGAPEERLRQTLRAAATDDELGILLRRGRLVTEAEPAGFGLDGLAGVAVAETRRRPAPAPAPAPVPARAEPPGPTAAEREAHRHAVREAERLRREADVAANRARHLADRAERAEADARTAREEADAAGQVAEDAERLAAEAAADAGIA